MSKKMYKTKIGVYEVRKEIGGYWAKMHRYDGSWGGSIFCQSSSNGLYKTERGIINAIERGVLEGEWVNC